MQRQSDRLILKFLSQMWFGSGEAFWESLTPAERTELLGQFTTYDLQPQAYYVLAGKLPPEQDKIFQQKYQIHSIAALKSKIAFAGLCKIFNDKKIRFCPVKGVDLSVRCYPAAALRSFCDWDVLIHPEDCLRALDELKLAGWQPLKKVNVNTAHHHFSVHVKDGFFLEPHRSLAQFYNVAPQDIWSEIKPQAPGSMQHVLSAELNILQLGRHAAMNNYSHFPAARLLQDAAAVICSENVDWQKLKRLAKQWHLPYPGDMLSVWDEFFPAEIISLMDANDGEKAKYRKLFSFQEKVNNIAPGEWAMSKHKGSMAEFIVHGLRQMTPRALIKKYRLPHIISWLLLPAIYLWDIIGKIFRLCHYMLFPDKKMKVYQQMVDDLEDIDEKE